VIIDECLWFLVVWGVKEESKNGGISGLCLVRSGTRKKILDTACSIFGTRCEEWPKAARKYEARMIRVFQI